MNETNSDEGFVVKEIYLIKKNGAVIPHANLTAMKEIDKVSVPDKTVSAEAWEAAGSRAFIDEDGDIRLGIPVAEQARQDEIKTLEHEEAALLKELASKDYQVLKSAEQGTNLADTDPELHQRRQFCRNRIHLIRERLSGLNTA
jgi:hypothetical protein